MAADGSVEVMSAPNEEKDTAVVSVPRYLLQVAEGSLFANRSPLQHSLTVRPPSHSLQPSPRLTLLQLPLPPTPRPRLPRLLTMVSTSV